MVEDGVDVEEEPGPLRRVEVADGAAEEREQPPAAAGQLAEVAVEVADDGVDLEPRALGGDRLGRRRASVASDTSKGTNRCSVPAPAKASSSSRVFSDVPEPSSTSVSAPVSAAISPARAARIARSARVG